MGVGHFECKFQVEKDVAIVFHRHENIESMFFRFVTKHACDKLQTDGQNYDPQYRAIIAASRGKNWVFFETQCT